MNAIINISSAHDAIVQHEAKTATIDDVWCTFFDTRAAAAYVDNHLRGLGSDRYEKHTRTSYERGLRYFLNWAGPQVDNAHLMRWSVYEFVNMFPAHRFPGPELIKEYIGHLNGRGLKKQTIESRYIAVLRHYLKGLRKQYVKAHRGDGITLEGYANQRDFISDCKDMMLNALDEKVPDTEKRGNISPLYFHGTRLKVKQVNKIFKVLGKSDNPGNLRDTAMLYTGFVSGLRDAEIRRLKLSGIRRADDGLCWQITVRGKRNNFQPIALDDTGYDLIMQYVNAYNAELEENDPRRIGHKDADGNETPLFQPLRKGGHICEVGVNRYDPKRGLNKHGVRDAVKKWSLRAIGVALSSHDMRRTMAAIMKESGAELTAIKNQLRHSSVAVTEQYVGNPMNLSENLVTNYVRFDVKKVG